jgi:formate dehydrogenase subunit delta
MSHDNLDQRLVYMANQIGKFFTTQSPATAAAGIENHLRKFWEPRMRNRIIAYLDKGDGELDDDPRQAVVNLRDKAEPLDAGNVVANPALSGSKLATGEDRDKGSTEAEPMIPDSVLRR